MIIYLKIKCNCHTGQSRMGCQITVIESLTVTAAVSVFIKSHTWYNQECIFFRCFDLCNRFWNIVISRCQIVVRSNIIIFHSSRTCHFRCGCFLSHCPCCFQHRSYRHFSFTVHIDKNSVGILKCRQLNDFLINNLTLFFQFCWVR